MLFRIPKILALTTQQSKAKLHKALPNATLGKLKN